MGEGFGNRCFRVKWELGGRVLNTCGVVCDFLRENERA